MQEMSLEKLVERLLNVERSAQDQRAELHRRIGEKVLARLQQEMEGGTTASWQESHVGSGGGYAAVRPDRGAERTKGSYGKPVRAYAHGHITNAIENGHQVRPPGPPSQRKKPNYRSQAKMSRVGGKGYYARTLAEAERIAREEVRRFLEELAKELEQ